MKITSLLILAASLAHTPTMASSLTMKTASEGGNYNTVICPAIAKHVAKSGVSIQCEPSAGSGENFAAVLGAGESTIGLGQIDVFGAELNTQTEAGNQDAEEAMAALGFIVPEALLCIAHRNGRLPDSPAAWSILNDDEAGEPFVISTYGETSGPAGTLAFLQSQFPNFAANTDIKHKAKWKHQIEMGKLRSGKRDLACFVTMPNPEDPRIADVMDDEDFFFVPFSDPQLGVVKSGKANAFVILDVPLTTGGIMSLFSKSATPSVSTITTGVAVYMNVDELDTTAYNALAKAVKDEALLPKDDGFVGQLATWKTSAFKAAGIEQ